MQRDLRAAQHLAGAEQDRAARRHERGIEDEDRIGETIVPLRDPLDLRARLSHARGEPVVLALHPTGIDRPRVVPDRRIRLTHRPPGTPHRDPPERGYHVCHPESTTSAGRAVRAASHSVRLAGHALKASATGGLFANVPPCPSSPLPASAACGPTRWSWSSPSTLPSGSRGRWSGYSATPDWTSGCSSLPAS